MNLGDIYRSIKTVAEDVIISATGRKITHLKAMSLTDSLTNAAVETELRGLYEIPLPDRNFGIREDEMVIEFGLKTLLKTLKKFPDVGEILIDDNGGQWKIVGRATKDNSAKLMVTVCRHQVSTTTA